jgi:uncharacterized membrane protein (UPF0127 family)
VEFRVINRTRGTVIAVCARRAGSFWERLRGLLGRAGLPKGEGLHLVPCGAIHMLFMRFAIDALFLDREDRVVKALALQPWQVSRSYPGVHSVLELPAGTLQATRTSEGDQLSFEPASNGF